MKFLSAIFEILFLFFSLLNSSAFAETGCQTATIWGTSTSDWRYLREDSIPARGICCYFIYSRYDYYLGYYTSIIIGSFGSLDSNEIVVGGKTQQCEGSIYLYASREDCVSDPSYCTDSGCVCAPVAPQVEYPQYITTETIYIAKLGDMG